jgi:TolB protein
LAKKLIPLLMMVLTAFSAPAWGKVYIDLAAPSRSALPVGVQEFRDLGPAPSAQDKAAREAIKKELYDAIVTDLRFSGFFKVIDKKANIEDPLKSGLTESETDFRSWRAIGADALVKGGFLLEGDKLTVEIRFFDCVTEKLVTGKKFAGSAKNPRRIVHFFSDAVYEELTGKKGVFTSKLLFVSGSGGNKEIYVSDYDGKNATKLTRNRSINLAPQWAPDGSRMLYVSYKRGTPAMYSLDLTTGRDDALSSRSGINIGGMYSPDGRKVALTLSGERSPELYVLDLDTKEYRRLTDNNAIDVSPTWSPDGRMLAYVSDSSGNPHIHVLDLSTGNSKRITFKGKYNSSPSWSPDGRHIAFARSDGGRFNIWVMGPGGEGLTQLTFDGDNRHPSWSPDGRYIVYSSSAGGGSLKIIRSDGTGVMKLDTGVKGEKAPAWSPYLR